MRDLVCGATFILLTLVLAGVGWLIMRETGNPWGFTIMVILTFYHCQDKEDADDPDH